MRFDIYLGMTADTTLIHDTFFHQLYVGDFDTNRLNLTMMMVIDNDDELADLLNKTVPGINNLAEKTMNYLETLPEPRCWVDRYNFGALLASLIVSYNKSTPDNKIIVNSVIRTFGFDLTLVKLS